MKTNQIYEVRLNVHCYDGTVPAQMVSGIRYREDSQLQQQIQKTTDPMAQFKLYRDKGYWYDAIHILATQRQAKPQDASLAKLWQDTLKSKEFSLDKIADQPFGSLTKQPS